MAARTTVTGTLPAARHRPSRPVRQRREETRDCRAQAQLIADPVLGEDDLATGAAGKQAAGDRVAAPQ
jgi:hypothetical protein